MAQNKVRAKIIGSKEIIVAGGSIIEGQVSPDTTLANINGPGADVDVEIEDGTDIDVAGVNVIRFTEDVSQPLDELANLLRAHLAKQEQIDDLLDIVHELKVQASPPANERKQVIIKRHLQNLGEYLKVATFAASLTGQAQNLYQKVTEILLGS